MICVRCHNDSKKKERVNRRCPSCHGEFAFEAGEPFTDRAFQSAIDAVSAEGRIKWGVEHLHYELCRRLRRKAGKTPLGCAVAATAAFVLLAVMASTGAGAAGIVALLAGVVAFLAWRWWLKKTFPLPKDKFEPIWNRWVSAHGPPPSRIVRREGPARPRAAESDLADYSFDRAVICDRARTVDLLLANNFHFENNCAVLSVSGYPPGPFETVRAMLRRNPKLEVFALHDATPEGCRLAHRLAHDPAWFQGHGPVTDVGLRPAHRGPFRGLFVPTDGARVVPGDGISAAEAAWLSAYALELAAIRPEQVLKRLFRAINRKEEDVGGGTTAAGDGGSGGDGVWHDESSFSSDASDSDGGADSFG